METEPYNLERQLWLRLKEQYLSAGHPLCPDCGECENRHQEDCLFASLLEEDAQDDMCKHGERG